MNIREELLMDLYEMVGCKEIYKESNKCLNENARLIEDCIEEIIGHLCDIDREAFLRGARAVLDIIAGKEESNEI